MNYLLLLDLEYINFRSIYQTTILFLRKLCKICAFSLDYSLLTTQIKLAWKKTKATNQEDHIVVIFWRKTHFYSIFKEHNFFVNEFNNS
jgi:hypothetical protein